MGEIKVRDERIFDELQKTFTKKLRNREGVNKRAITKEKGERSERQIKMRDSTNRIKRGQQRKKRQQIDTFFIAFLLLDVE